MTFQCLTFGTAKGVFFVIRHKENMKFQSIKERELPENTAQHVLKNEEIELTNAASN